MTSDTLLLQLLEDMPTAALLVTLERRILYANPAAEKLLQQTDSELRDKILPLQLTEDALLGNTGQLELPNGKQLPVRHFNVPTVWHGNTVRMVHLEDVSAVQGLQQQLSDLVNYDSLTGLPNRGLLEDRLKQAFSFGQRNKGVLAVVFLDLDGFKPINDTLGHELGDRLLKQVVERLQSFIRPSDTIARLGGDEFVLVLPNLSHIGDAAAVTERMLQSIAEPFELDSHELHISASAGIATTELYDEDPLQLIRQADMAMFEAKRRGRNQYQWFDQSLDTRTVKSLKIRNALRSGIEQKQFEVHYQPQFDLHNNDVVGVESLVRWNHPTMGMISPAEFIQIAENTGEIVRLGRWILRRACKDFVQLKQQMPNKATVSVNISAIQLLRHEFVDEVAQALRESGLDARHLVLEMTESVLVEYPQLISEKLAKLNQLGVKLALDDFGTGYSSLSYLKDLPVSWVKIDRSFITELTHDSRDTAITEGIISMAHHLQLEVMAEGVETTAQRDYLRRSGCDAMQGFLMAKPMPKPQLDKFLSQYQASISTDEPSSEATVMIVDDEENVNKSLRRLLMRDGYHILTANSANEAFDLLAQHNVDVVISDHRMPQMQGVEFLTHVRSMYPNTQRIVLTAYQDEEALARALNEGEVFRFLTKPWDDETIRQSVRAALQG